jgi:acyl-CoA hydrolase
VVGEPAEGSVAESRSSVVRLMMPSDANYAGNVFGGVILAEVDRVAYVAASRHARTACVTASIDRVDFLAPVRINDVVEFTAEISFVHHTSMEVIVRILARGLPDAAARRVGDAYVTIVAVDADGRPTPVPPLALATDEEKVRFEEGRRRFEQRRAERARRHGG